MGLALYQLFNEPIAWALAAGWILAEQLVVAGDQTAAAIVVQANQHAFLILGVQEESWCQTFFFGTRPQQVAGQVSCATLLVWPRRRKKAGAGAAAAGIGQG